MRLLRNLARCQLAPVHYQDVDPFLFRKKTCKQGHTSQHRSATDSNFVRNRLTVIESASLTCKYGQGRRHPQLLRRSGATTYGN